MNSRLIFKTELILGKMCLTIGIISILLLCSCSTQKAPRPDIVLISLDTLRNDRMAAGGNHRCYSPALDSLIRNSTYFINTSSPIAATGPAHSTLLTGLLPIHHKSRDVGDPLERDIGVTLAQILNQTGYQTTAIVSSSVMWSNFSGLDRGFNRYLMFPKPMDLSNKKNQTKLSVQAKLKNINDRKKKPKPKIQKKLSAMMSVTWETITEELEKLMIEPATTPRLLFVHFYDVHIPYSSPGLYDKLYANEKYDGNMRGRYSDASAFNSATDRDTLDTQDHEHMKALYDSGVSYVDKGVQKVVQYIYEYGDPDNTLVIIMSDHGEGFGEFGEYFGHGKRLSESQLRVPLFFYWPGHILPGLIPDRVGLEDVFPTVLDILQIQSPNGIDGRSLIDPLMLNKPLINRDYVYETCSMKLDSERFKQFGLVDGKYKYVLPVNERPEQLFDLVADPEENNNLAVDKPDLSKQLKKQLSIRLIGADTDLTRPDLDESSIRALQALGYMQ